MNNGKTYHDLLDKLVSGTITDSERWQLERASLDDPFLADALEGYYTSAIDKERLKALSVIQKSKVRSLVPVYMIAASLAVLVVISFFLFDQIRTDDESPIVAESTERIQTVESEAISQEEVEEEGTLPVADEKAITEEEKVEPLIEESVSQPVKVKKSKDIAPKPTSPAHLSNKATKAEDHQALRPQMQKEQKDVDQSSGARAKALTFDRVATVSTIASRGVVTDYAGMPIPGAEVSVPGKSMKTVTNSSGTFYLDSVTEQDYLLITKPGYLSEATPVIDEVLLRLKKIDNIPGKDQKTLEEMMAMAELKRSYRIKLDNYLDRQQLNCPIGVRYRLYLSIDNTGSISEIDFIDTPPDECRNEIEDTLNSAASRGLFGGKQFVEMYYRIGG